METNSDTYYWPSCAECFGNMGRYGSPDGTYLMRCEQCGHEQHYTAEEMDSLQPYLARAYKATIRIQRKRFPRLFAGR